MRISGSLRHDLV